jgi:hypothetical protein
MYNYSFGNQILRQVLIKFMLLTFELNLNWYPRNIIIQQRSYQNWSHSRRWCKYIHKRNLDHFYSLKKRDFFPDFICIDAMHACLSSPFLVSNPEMLQKTRLAGRAYLLGQTWAETNPKNSFLVSRPNYQKLIRHIFSQISVRLAMSKLNFINFN